MRLHSLKSKFITVIILVSLLVGLMTLFSFNLVSSRIIDGLALRFATKEALLERNKILSIIDREVVLARKMADDSTLRKWALDESNRQLKQQALTELESYRRFYRDKSFFLALSPSNHYYVYNKKVGHERVEVVTLDAAKTDDKWFFDGLRKIDDYALNLDYNPTLQEAKVWFNAVMSDESGKRIGICGGGITITDFLNEIVNSREKGLSTVLIDSAGVIQAHEDRKIVEHNANTRDAAGKITIYSLLDEAPRQEQLREALKVLLAGKSEVQAFPARFQGKNYLLAVSYLQGVGWFNVVLVDVSSVISISDFLPIIVIMLLSLLLLIVTIVMLINRMVLVPLNGLSVASGEIAAGRYDTVLPVNGKDELAELTGSFNTMAALVLDHTSNLEYKVRERTDQLSSANRQLEESRNRVMKSISYARLIQSSILPGKELLERCLGENFVLYRPKEIVGGDFYYLREFPGHFLLALVDCTGHGVPGAFMTMTASAELNHVVDTVCCDDPARILSELNRLMHNSLNFGEVDAGLDIALCMVERHSGRLLFSGAGLALNIVSNGQLREVRGNNQRVGYKGSRLDYVYTNHEVSLAPGDCCYLTTDGVLDEQGGSKGYGFGAQRLRKVLTEHCRLPMPAQLEELERTLGEYRGNYSQRDDITVLGFRY